MPDVHEGGCACGEIRYRLTSAPMFVHCCHCKDCQHWSGSAFAVNAPIERDRVDLTVGPPSAAVIRAARGREQVVWRCDRCGTTLWSHHPEFGDGVAMIAIGTLDDPAALPPQVHCFTRSKLPWVILPGGVPATEGIYDLDACWPAASRERLRVAMEAAAANRAPAAQRIKPGPP